MLRRALHILLFLVALIAVAGLGVLAVANSDWGRARIIALVEDSTAGGPVALRIGALGGTLPGRIELRDVVAADRDGDFARAETLVLDWSVLDLLAARVSVTEISLSNARLDRLPVLPETPEEPEPRDPEPLSLSFESPGIEIAVDRLSVDALTLGAAVAGEAMTVSADLSAALTAEEARARGWIEAAPEEAPETAPETGPAARAEIDAALVPSTGVLRADLSFREPENGLIAGLLAVEGRPALDLALSGAGGLDDWQGALKGGFGPDARIDLDLAIGSGAEGYSLAVNGTVAAAGVAPPDLRPLLSDPATVDLAVLAATDGRLLLRNLELALPAGLVTASGTVDAQGTPVAAEAALTVPELAAFADLAGTELAGRLALTATLDEDGRRLVARISGGPSAAGIVLDGLALTLAAEADTALASLPDRVRLALDGGVATPAGEGVDTVALLGPRVELSASGSVVPETGAVTVDRLVLDSAGLRAEGSAGFAGGNRLTPTLTVSAADLGRLAGLTGLDLSGGAELSVDGTVRLDPLDVSATLAVTGSALGLGDPALDDLVGPSPALTTGITLDADQRLTLVGLTLDASAARASGDVALDLAAGGIEGRIDLAAPDLSALGAVAGTDLGGAGAVAVALGGTLDAPAASASWRIVDLAVAGIAVEETTGSVTAAGLPDAPAGEIRARARLRGEPVDLSLAYALTDRVLRIGDLSLDGLGATVTGDLSADLDTTLARGDLALSAADLAVIGNALDLPLAGGRVGGAIRFSDADGQGAAATLEGAGLVLADGTAVERLSLEASLDDLNGAMGGRLDLRVDGAETGGLAFKVATLGADLRDGVADLVLNAEGDVGLPVVLAAAASVPLDPVDGPITVGRLDADLGDAALRQRGPIRIALDGGPRIDGLDLGIDDGRLSGHAGLDPADLDVDIVLRGVPAALARLADPTLELDGRIDGEIAVTGSLENPVGRVALSTAGIRTLEPTLSDLPPLIADLVLEIRDRRATARLDASIGEGATVSLGAEIQGSAGATGSPPVFEPTAALEARLDADADLGRVSTFLPLDTVALGGTAQARVTAGGTLGDPGLAGAVTIDGGEVDMPAAGLYLRDLAVRAEGEGRELVIRRFEARAAGGGTLSASGSVSADAEAGFPAEITLTADRFNAVDMDLATVSVDIDLALDGALPEYLLAGTVTVLPTEIRIPDTLPPSVTEIEVVEVRDGRVIETPEQQARREREERQEEEAGAPLRLDVEIDVPGQVFVRGRGLDSEWAGTLAVTGLADAPQVEGEIAVRRGVLNAVGNNFDFERGRVIFNEGPPDNPALDMRLVADLPDIAAAIAVTGRANDPDISLESDPALPEEEILSRILFGSSRAELTPVQALKLARSAAILSGGFGSGSGFTSEIRETLGVDTIDVDTSTNEDGSVGASLSVGKYIAPGVFLKLQQGLSGASSRAVVEVEVTDNISVETDVGADSQSRVGVTYELDY